VIDTCGDDDDDDDSGGGGVGMKGRPSRHKSRGW